jgi:cobalamin biosynthesis protein CobW
MRAASALAPVGASSKLSQAMMTTRQTPPPPPAPPAPSRVLGLVVSGFLGSGKTTLVRRLLEQGQREGIPTAVVSNELGALGIDRALLAGTGEIVELEGGCVCCRLGDELVKTLAELRVRSRPRRLIVETSGAALPYDTLLHFWREPVRDWFEDDASLVVVNAEQVIEGRDLTGTFEDQVASADLIVVNKLDLVGPDDVERIDAFLREIEPDAPILHTTEGCIDPRVIFPPDSRTARIERRDPAAATGEHSHDHFACEVVTEDARSGIEELSERLTALDAVRIKGFVQAKAAVVLVQGVGRRITVTPTDIPAPPGALGRLVVIRRK